MNIWQIATGEPGRDYRELFINYDIMILGPGKPGNAIKNKNVYNTGKPNSSLRQVHNFVNRPKSGDRIIMRFANKVIGIGQIPQGDESQYIFSDIFACVYGWDLNHCRRVIWAKEHDALDNLSDVYKNSKQKPSFTQIHEKAIIDAVSYIDNSYFDRSLKKMPNVDSSVYSDEELGVKLFRAGISNKNIEDIIKALRQAERLCSWYSHDKEIDRPTEHEIVSHMLLPLFLGLGWSHQQIAVEWKNVDMAFFKKTPTKAENCVMILEAKSFGRPLSEVLDQPKRYVKNLGLKNVKYILTTDGINLFVYVRSKDSWDSGPIGYLNIQKLQKEYILPKGTSLIKTLVDLQSSML